MLLLDVTGSSWILAGRQLENTFFVTAFFFWFSMFSTLAQLRLGFQSHIRMIASGFEARQLVSLAECRPMRLHQLLTGWQRII